MFGLKKSLQAIQTFSKTQLAPRVFTRGKRTGRKGLQPGAQRLINMLSVFSARKKQPRRLKLSLEDKIRHNTVKAAWSIHMRDKRLAREALLEKQYERMTDACNELEKVSPYLAYQATVREKSKRFSPEMRVPTEFPPNKPWDFDWAPQPPKSK
ncbi:large ribosomal subunit protein mL40 [Trichomonascus vanleenenianus]|uniref:mitochondrial 54S ribosomal protein mL40 MRPL28 n=1 Tax=Trichomonascus vanleenenianus TaxID=2268995 RepID=UPI003ECB5916